MQYTKQNKRMTISRNENVIMLLVSRTTKANELHEEKDGLESHAACYCETHFELRKRISLEIRFCLCRPLLDFIRFLFFDGFHMYVMNFEFLTRKQFFSFDQFRSDCCKRSFTTLFCQHANRATPRQFVVHHFVIKCVAFPLAVIRCYEQIIDTHFI